jgi:hypothetical protein
LLPGACALPRSSMSSGTFYSIAQAAGRPHSNTLAPPKLHIRRNPHQPLLSLCSQLVGIAGQGAPHIICSSGASAGCLLCW